MQHLNPNSMLFLLWDCINERVLMPPMPHDLQDFHQRITTTFAKIDHDMLKRVYGKFDFRIDICASQNIELTCQTYMDFSAPFVLRYIFI